MKRSNLNETMTQEELNSLQALRDQAKEKDKALMRLLIPSILSMFLCMACLFSMTWAWFADTTESSPSRIVAGSYEVKVEVAQEVTPGNMQVIPTDANGVVTLAAGTYQITFTAYGTGDPAFGGYGIVLLSDDPNAQGLTQNSSAQKAAFTALLKNGTPGDKITVTLVLSESTAIDFNSCWGVPPSAEGDIRLVAGDTLTFAADGAVTVTPAQNSVETTAEQTTETTAP